MHRIAELIVGEFRISPWRTLGVLPSNRRIIVGRHFRVRGARRIEVTSGQLRLGLRFFGFVDNGMRSLLRVRGRLAVDGPVTLCTGNRWDIGADAVATVGAGTYFGPMTTVVITRSLRVGAGCAISWNCTFLDSDFHTLGPGPKASTAAIVIGDHVWIGTHVTLLKGAAIADGCVVAANATVTGQFLQPRCLLAGTPARVVRTDVTWS